MLCVLPSALRPWAAILTMVAVAGPVAQAAPLDSAPVDLGRLRVELARHLDEEALRFWIGRALQKKKYGGFLPILDDRFEYTGDTARSVMVAAKLLYNRAVAVERAAPGNAKAGMRDQLARQVREFREVYWDTVDGGLWWEVNTAHMPATDQKKTIAQLFATYVLAEVDHLATVEEARTLALEIYDAVESRAWDADHGGYLEDYELAPGERANRIKHLTTQLHGLMAAARLHAMTPEARFERRGERLVGIITTRYGAETPGHHVATALRRDWKPLVDGVSRGPTPAGGGTPSAIWQTLHAAQLLGLDKSDLQSWAKGIAAPVLETGISAGGAVYAAGRSDQALVSWASQTEALVMLMKLYELTADEVYLRRFEQSHRWARQFLAADGTGCWVAAADAQGRRLPGNRTGSDSKAGLHVVRCLRECVESLGRIQADREAP